MIQPLFLAPSIAGPEQFYGFSYKSKAEIYKPSAQGHGIIPPMNTTAFSVQSPEDALQFLREPNSLAALAEMGEFLAIGWLEGLNLPWPRAYGLAIRRHLEQVEIEGPNDGPLMPVSVFPFRYLDEDTRSLSLMREQGTVIALQHSAGLILNPSAVVLQTKRFPQHADCLEALVLLAKNRWEDQGGGYTHTNPDLVPILSGGFPTVENALSQAVQKATTEKERNLLAALSDVASGIRSFVARTVEVARQHLLPETADDLELAFEHGAKTFRQGLLLTNLVWILDISDSIGPVDRRLGALWDADVASGRMSREEGRFLIDVWFQRFEQQKGWNLVVGGRNGQGQDVACDLTRELILACGRQNLTRPNLAFRITSDTPKSLVEDALKVLATGTGRPALYNDDLYQRLLQEMGVSPDDAGELAFGGCTETMIAGLSNIGSLQGTINLVPCLIEALQELPEVRDFAVFRAILLEKIRVATDRAVAYSNKVIAKRRNSGDPKLMRTLFTRDCLETRRSFEDGGARYNWALFSYDGLATLIDSVFAVKRLVFDEGTISGADLLLALKANFVGHETLLHKIESLPRYGNDAVEVDSLGADLVGETWQHLRSHSTPRGGIYLPSIINFLTYAEAGKNLGATPDGRRAGAPLSDSVGPYFGRDRKGPTAMLNSVLRLPLHLALGTPVLNLRVQRKILEETGSRLSICALLESFFARGGLQLQISVLDAKRLRAAQKDPAAAGDLIVRIGGYSERFVRLSPALQESVIERSEY